MTPNLGYAISTPIFFGLFVVTVLGSVSVSTITSRKVEIFYWTAILFSNTLGTALGDFFADTSGFGHEGSALIFSACLALIAAAYLFTAMSHTRAFLNGVYPHASARRDRGRFPHEASLQGRARSQPHLVFADHRLHSLTSQKAGSHLGAEEDSP